jgi:hypothetical protein
MSEGRASNMSRKKSKRSTVDEDEVKETLQDHWDRHKERSITMMSGNSSSENDHPDQSPELVLSPIEQAF